MKVYKLCFKKLILTVLSLDPSDTDLRHALANMIAVVFALPSRSNHIWYHMFCPGELNDTFMTGFMVNVTMSVSTTV